MLAVCEHCHAVIKAPVLKCPRCDGMFVLSEEEVRQKYAYYKKLWIRCKTKKSGYGQAGIMTTFYKIRHRPTGLFWYPSRYGRVNLSENGRVYQQRPSLKLLGPRYRHPTKIDKAKEWEWRDFVENEWEIVEYQAQEVG